MSVSGVSDSTEYWKKPTSTETDKTKSNSAMDFQSFLQILATELQYQDPQNPVDASEYVSQMASFASLNQVQTITNSIDANQAYSLIGKSVIYKTTDDAGNQGYATGSVGAVTIKNNVPYLNIGNTQVKLSDVVTVGGSATNTSDQLQDLAYGVAANQAYGLIGKSVSYKTKDSAGKEIEGSGTVSSVSIKDGVPYLNIGNTQVKLSEVTSVGETTTK